MPSKAKTLPRCLKASPVKVTTRSINGSPLTIARLIANAVPTFCIITPIEVERAWLGTSRPVNSFTNCFELPDGYLVGITRIIILSSSLTQASNALIASGLLSSIPIKVNFGAIIWRKMRMPSITSSA